MSASFKIKDNSRKLLGETEVKKEKILYMIGLKWQSIVTRIITQKRIVDTGRLRASMSFITSKRQGKGGGANNTKSTDFISGRARKDELVVGTNVEYARKNEMENRKGDFLRPSIMEYKDTYKQIAESVFRE